MKKTLFLLFGIFPLLFFGQTTDENDSIVIKPFEISNLTAAADETELAISSIINDVNSNKSSNKILNEFRKVVSHSNAMRMDTSEAIFEEYNQWSLNDLQNKWTRYGLQIEGFKKSLNKLSEEYQKEIIIVEGLQNRWSITNINTDEIEIPEAIIDRSKKVINSLEVTAQLLKDSLVTVLADFDEVSTEYTFTVSIEQRIKAISDSKKLNIFSKNAQPFFQDLKTRKDSTNIASQISNTWTSTISDTIGFIRENKDRSEFHLIVILLITALFFYISYSYKKANIEVTEELKLSDFLIRRPLYISMVFNLFISFWMYPKPPSFITQLILFLLLLPLILLLPGLLQKKYRLIVYVATVLYLLNQTEEFMPLFPITQRIILMTESLMAFAGMIYILRPKGAIYVKGYPYRKWIIRLAFLYLIFSTISIYGNLVGSLSLSKMLIRTVIINVSAGIALFLLYRIFKSLISFFLISKTGQSLNLVQVKGDKIKSNILLYSGIAGVYLFVRNLIGLLGLNTFISDSYKELLLVGWDFGNVYLSIGQVLNFALILFVFSLIASFLRNLIEIEILPRFNLKKGFPMAVGLMTRYTILLLGFLMAVAAAGISLDKLGFIVGALGVGIGFGLQSVVGNFVSGMILIIERPVRVGDTITTSTIEGTVTEIGIRASKIRDWDGAEVIVPNMELISQHVTNWTLSDSQRRRELIIKTEYISDPQVVIDIILKVIKDHPRTLIDPEPLVLYLGFKEYSMDYRVLFWVTENMLATTSDVAVGIHTSLKKAGIKIAIPKRTLIQEKNDIPEEKTIDSEKSKNDLESETKPNIEEK